MQQSSGGNLRPQNTRRPSNLRECTFECLKPEHPTPHPTIVPQIASAYKVGHPLNIKQTFISHPLLSYYSLKLQGTNRHLSPSYKSHNGLFSDRTHSKILSQQHDAPSPASPHRCPLRLKTACHCHPRWKEQCRSSAHAPARLGLVQCQKQGMAPLTFSTPSYSRLDQQVYF